MMPDNLYEIMFIGKNLVRNDIPDDLFIDTKIGMVDLIPEIYDPTVFRR